MKTPDVYSYIERLSNLLRADIRRSGAEYGLQPVQMEALHYLSVCNKYSDTPMAVTEYLGQTKGTVSQTLKVLERKGMIQKEADKDDKRVTHLRIVAAGQNVLKKSLPTSLFLHGFTELGASKLEEIESALEILLMALLRSNKMKTFGVCKTCHFNQCDGDGKYYCDLLKTSLAHKEVELICKEHQEKQVS